MSRSAKADVHVPSYVKENEMSAVVTVGPETAARLGVPVGTKVDLGVISYYHRFPPVGLLTAGPDGRAQWWGEYRKWRRSRKKLPRHVLNV